MSDNIFNEFIDNYDLHINKIYSGGLDFSYDEPIEEYIDDNIEDKLVSIKFNVPETIVPIHVQLSNTKKKGGTNSKTNHDISYDITPEELSAIIKENVDNNI